MKNVNAPEIFNETFKVWLSENVTLYTELLDGAKAKRDYLPWRKERYLAPEGILPEVWWSILQFARNVSPIDPRLVGKNGAFFLFSNTRRIHELLHQIDVGIGGFAFRTEAPITEDMPPKMLRTYLQLSQFLEAISSSQMEGAATTRQVAKQMLTENRAPQNDSERMIVNNYKTIHQLEAWKECPMTEALLLKIHNLMTEGILPEEKRGRYRSDEDNVVVTNQFGEVVYTPPEAKELPERIKRLLEFANASESDTNDFLHPVLKATLLHILLAYEHPFCDGNGRTARALFYWKLLHDGYWLAPYVSISKELKAMRSEYDHAYLDMECCALDLTYCVLVNLEAFLKGIHKFHAFIKQESRHQTDLREQFGKMLNFRQLELLKHTLRHETYHYQAAEHQRWHNISANTARADINDLVAKGYLTAHTIGRQTYYTSTGQFARLQRNV